MTDASSGLMLLGNRYYDSTTGRFISQDPAQDESNWYAYCGNNPLVATDPTGLLAGNLTTISQAPPAKPEVAFIAVGDTSGNKIVQASVNAQTDRMKCQFEKEGYKVVVKKGATSGDIRTALADSDVQAFGFIGHGSPSSNPNNSYLLLSNDKDITAAQIKGALGGRQLKELTVQACFSDTTTMRACVIPTGKYVAHEGLYMPVVNADAPKFISDFVRPILTQ